MALEQRDRLIERGNGRGSPVPPARREPSIGELFGQLSNDASRLIQQEMALARAELRETASMLARDAAKFAVAAVLGLLGEERRQRPQGPRREAGGDAAHAEGGRGLGEARSAGPQA